MSDDSNRARPSSAERRSPHSILSAIGPREGSLSSLRSSGTASGMESVSQAANRKRDVMATEPEAVAQRDLDVAAHGAIRRVVEIELRVAMLVIDRRRHDTITHGQ